jgi:trans-aconitate 2-methyltransferase
MTEPDVSADEVQHFYDTFRDSRMLRYRLQRNRRIDAAVRRVRAHIRPHHRVLEIGCGIGIVTEAVAQKLRTGRVWACDISPKNIEYAAATVRSRKAEFFACDALREFLELRKRLHECVDVILLIDVLEHLPLESHLDLFQNLRRICSDDALVILTYPTPEYQEYLRHFEPDQLQIIDETISDQHLLDTAERAGFVVNLFSRVDVWRRNQYVHCVLSATSPIVKLDAAAGRRGPQFIRRFVGAVERFLLIPLRRVRYARSRR